jgi:tryptophanyl-tRNA synthetase
MLRVLTGVKPTGTMPHLGNLLGAILPFQKIAKQPDTDALLFIADLHALTSVLDAKTLEANLRNLVASYLAVLGLDTPVTIFRQSDVTHLTKLNWVLNNVTPYSLMLRAHSFKDAEAKNADINMGVFNYPILMAADIIGYDADVVPVGRDQVQHLEMTRDVARAFNKAAGKPVFKEPKAHVEKDVEVLPGLDGRKMSKSYDNYIGIFEDAASLKKKVMSIKTDSKGVDEAKDPETCAVFALYRIFATPAETAALRAKYVASNAGFGYGHAKQALLDVLERLIAPYRQKRDFVLNNWGIAEAKLHAGATRANALLNAKMAQVKAAVGV